MNENISIDLQAILQDVVNPEIFPNDGSAAFSPIPDLPFPSLPDSRSNLKCIDSPLQPTPGQTRAYSQLILSRLARQMMPGSGTDVINPKILCDLWIRTGARSFARVTNRRVTSPLESALAEKAAVQESYVPDKTQTAGADIMPIKITIDIFSERPNPVIELSGIAEKEALERLQRAGKVSKAEGLIVPQFVLGYRGLIVEQTGAVKAGLPKSMRYAHGDVASGRTYQRATDVAFKDFLCRAKGPFSQQACDDSLMDLIQREIERKRGRAAELIRIAVAPHLPRIGSRTFAPLYEPSWWNDGGQKQMNNNCYNYATNHRTDTFAQPGQADGASYTALTCASVSSAAVEDWLINSPLANN